MSQPLAKVLEVHDVGDDVLVVIGEVAGEPARARGWVSATTNHFDREHYSRRTGHRSDAAEPREMTDDEIRRYARQLLIEQNPPPAETRQIL